jgi:hypothetical protein
MMYVSANEKAVSLNLHRYTKVLTLMDIMREFLAFRCESVERRAAHELAKVGGDLGGGCCNLISSSLVPRLTLDGPSLYFSAVQSSVGRPTSFEKRPACPVTVTQTDLNP